MHHNEVEISFYYPSLLENLPEDGWLQTCRYCKNQVTGNLMPIKHIEGKVFSKKYSIYVCKNCKKKINNNEKTKKDFLFFSNKLVFEYQLTGKIKSKKTKVQYNELLNNVSY